MDSLGISILLKGTYFLQLLKGLSVTIEIAVISMFLSLVFGFIVGILMNSHNKIVQIFFRLYLESVRILPQLVLLYLVYFGAATNFGLNLSGFTAAVIAFTYWGAAEMGDLVRSSLISVDPHQYESAYGLGLKKHQVYRFIIIPQTVKRLIPSVINLFTRMVKTTSLVVLIGVVEVVKVGKQIIDVNRFIDPNSAIWIYGTIFLMYFVICYPFTKLASYLENKVA